MIWTSLTEGIAGALRAIGAGDSAEAGAIELAVPRDATHGDWTSNVAMVLARTLKRPPRALAEAIAAAFPADPRLEPPTVAGPGFLNFRYRTEFLASLPGRIRTAGESFGRHDHAGGEGVVVEYVSANPTGPLNVVSGRAAAVGAALVRLLRATGHRAEGEFYVNDAGNQVDLLGASMAARFAERIGEVRPFPEQGYRGEYLGELAVALPEAEARAALTRDDVAWFRREALERMLASQQRDLADYGAEFATWFRESTVHQRGDVAATVRELEQRDMTYRATRPEVDTGGREDEDEAPEAGEATWLRTSRFGDEKDRVIVKSDGQPTYLLPDIAYHRDKRARGFRRAIDLWGPDHHAHIARMKAALRALGVEPDFLEVLIVQQVNLLSGGQPVKMSKRAGEFVTLRDLMDDVGADCAKFFFLMRGTNAHLDFDLDLARRQNDDNPAFYVQYAHARICSVIAYGAERGQSPGSGADLEGGAPEEIALIRLLATFPEVIRGAAFTREPQRVPAFLIEASAAFHRFYHACRVVTDDAARTRSRLELADATRIVLRNGLQLIGVTAPERMERAVEPVA